MGAWKRCLSGWLCILAALGLLARTAPGSTRAGGQDGPAQGAAWSWVDRTLRVPYSRSRLAPAATLQVMRQDFGQLERNRSVVHTPLTIGKRRFQHGLGTHAVSHLRFHSPEPILRFSAWIGVDNNERSLGGSVVFSIAAEGRELYRSAILRSGQEPERVEVAVGGAGALDLHVGDAGDSPGADQANWADANVITQSGKTLRLDELRWELGAVPVGARYPFSFRYGGRSSDDLLGTWRQDQRTRKLDAHRTKRTTVWTDPATGLRLHWDVTTFEDYSALDWVLYFENGGSTDTPVIEDIQALDLTFQSPISGHLPYRLHRTNGAPANPTDFEPSVLAVDRNTDQTLSGGGGLSSARDFPFFKVETGEASIIAAVGWSGQWRAHLECPDGQQLRVTAGMEKTHFLLLPGEKLRSPRTLLLYWPGDTLEANAQFRQLIYRHYAAPWNGTVPEPVLFCNTCFTRGGGGLNETAEQGELSLLNAYAALGVEALVTDAGWFEGGFPAGSGNWTPRKDAYPNGMAPLAAAARRNGMLYGLWFEPERVVAGTDIHKNHPEWVLASGEGPQATHLLNFGLPEVQEYFFNVVKGYMQLPGFRVYRQDFNMDPLPYWRYNDAPDRQGVTEIKHIQGLYAFWDRIAETWPDSLREECASGGRRIDLETVMCMHLHQDSDYWFDNDVDQGQIWGLSQYLPNNLFVAHLNRMDDYSFHSTMASSLCVGWAADAPGFDVRRGKELLARYRKVRPLFTGAWYPLLPYSRRATDWMASQYHRPDLDRGVILMFRHADSPYRTVDVALHGLDAAATYELSSDSTGVKTRVSGRALMQSFLLTLPDRQRSDLVEYRKVPR
jgi:alpha-galactosidase